MIALDLNQILSRISQFYHDDFRKQIQPLFQTDESVVWAGNCSEVGRDDSNVPSSFGAVGYVLLTSYRAIEVTYVLEYGHGRNKIVLDKFNSAASPLTSPLTRKEEGPYIREVLLHNIVGVNPRNYEVVNLQKKTVTLPVIRVATQPESKFDWLFYSPQDGSEVYKILQRAMRTTPAPPQENLLSELERLYALHKSGGLTDVEFQNAKRKLGI